MRPIAAASAPAPSSVASASRRRCRPGDRQRGRSGASGPASSFSADAGAAGARGAHAGTSTAGQGDDAIGERDQRRPVRDEDHRAAAREAADRLDDAALGGAVEVRGGLVEQQQRRVAQERARQGDRWRSPAERPGAALAEHVSQPVAAARAPSRSSPAAQIAAAHLRVAGAGAPEPHVLGDRGAEQVRALGHPRQPRARQASRSRSARSTPPTRTEPDVGATSPSRTPSSVDLPQPLGPVEREHLARRATVSETPSSAGSERPG